MSRRLISALVLLVVAIVVLVLNTGSMRLDLAFAAFRVLKSVAFLSFLVTGIVIGLLLK